MRSLPIVGLAAAMLTLAGCASTAGSFPTDSTTSGRYSFGLWGDMPYQKAGDAPKMPALLDSLNRSDIAFSLYDGDIKDGSSRCGDGVYTDALRMFGQIDKPLVYIPGDNEWTDCHRLNNGGYDALERLAHLRRVMIPTTASLGRQPMALERQGALGQPYAENLRFSHGPVVFVGLNVPGSNNNLILDAKECAHKSARTPAQCEASNAEYRARDAANIAWLEQSFQQARAHKARGVVLVLQADPGFDLPETEDIDESQAAQVSGYRAFMAAVAKQTASFDGQVLFVHGDTHYFKVDKPLNSPTKLLPNFTRLQTFGSPSIHWVKVTVNPASSALFQIEPVIVAQPSVGASK